MNKKYIFILAVLLIASCGNDKTAETTKEDDIKKECVKHLKAALKDEDSYESKDWLMKQMDSTAYGQYTRFRAKYTDYTYKYFPQLLIHKYKANNNLGFKVVNTVYFMIDSAGSFEMVDEVKHLPFYMQ